MTLFEQIMALLDKVTANPTGYTIRAYNITDTVERGYLDIYSKSLDFEVDLIYIDNNISIYLNDFKGYNKDIELSYIEYSEFKLALAKLQKAVLDIIPDKLHQMIYNKEPNKEVSINDLDA